MIRPVCSWDSCTSTDTEQYANVERQPVRLCKNHSVGMPKFKSREDLLDELFPKGDKRRSDAEIIMLNGYADGWHDLQNHIRSLRATDIHTHGNSK